MDTINNKHSFGIQMRGIQRGKQLNTFYIFIMKFSNYIRLEMHHTLYIMSESQKVYDTLDHILYDYDIMFLNWSDLGNISQYSVYQIFANLHDASCIVNYASRGVRDQHFTLKLRLRFLVVGIKSRD